MRQSSLRLGTIPSPFQRLTCLTIKDPIQLRWVARVSTRLVELLFGKLRGWIFILCSKPRT